MHIPENTTPFTKMYFQNFFFRSETQGILKKMPTTGRKTLEEMHCHLIVTTGRKYRAVFTRGVTSRKILIHPPYGSSVLKGSMCNWDDPIG